MAGKHDAEFWQGIHERLAAINTDISQHFRWHHPVVDGDPADFRPLDLSAQMGAAKERRDRAIIREWERESKDMPVKKVAAD